MLIPSFKVSGGQYWQPVFFNNFPGSKTGEEPVIDALLAGSAASVYFPAFEQHVDGGVIAYNPSTAAVSMAIDDQAGGQRLQDIVPLRSARVLVPTGLPPIPPAGARYSGRCIRPRRCRFC